MTALHMPKHFKHSYTFFMTNIFEKGQKRCQYHKGKIKGKDPREEQLLDLLLNIFFFK